jgi:hypothetical protein
MTGSTRAARAAGFTAGVALSALAALAGGAASAHAASSCGIVTAAGHPFIVVAKGITCPSATGVVRALAARTAAVRTGQRLVVHSPLRGFTCVLASQGKPGGSCSTAGAAKSVLWIIAA